MGIVRFALRLPYTFYVLAALILFLGITAIRVMPTDIFPQINIPVVTVIWQYTGLSTPEMEQRVTTYSQYSISSNVNGIRNMEAQTLNGFSVQKIYFQPDVNLDLAIAQIVSATNSIRALMPPGINPPVVVQFNASSVPVLQLSLSSDTLSEQQLYDYGIYRLRQQLAPVHGVTFPTPAGGKYRQIMVDLDPQKLLARGLTPMDVVNAVNAQNLTVPSGTAKIGSTQYTVTQQCDARNDRRPQQHSRQVYQRRHGLRQGCRPGPGWIASAAEHCARERPAFGAAERDQEWQCFDPRRGQRGQKGAADRTRGGAGRPEDQRAV
jgi:multidrug efflux pump subunit AcrB